MNFGARKVDMLKQKITDEKKAIRRFIFAQIIAQRDTSQSLNMVYPFPSGRFIFLLQINGGIK